MKMRLKPKATNPEPPAPKSFRLSKETLKKLEALTDATGKKSGALITELIEMAYRDTVKRK